MELHRSIHKYHCFFWDTKLSDERMKEINNWIGTFTPEQRKMFDDLLWDYRDEIEWNCSGDNTPW